VRRALGILIAAIPFAFGIVRALETGRDFRYLLVAVAATLGGMISFAIGRRRSDVILGMAVWLLATVFASVAALVLGTTFGPALIFVAAGFGICTALGIIIAARDVPSRASQS
jgi:hypothetical protein